jgi:hypothetical protein
MEQEQKTIHSELYVLCRAQILIKLYLKNSGELFVPVQSSKLKMIRQSTVKDLLITHLHPFLF